MGKVIIGTKMILKEKLNIFDLNFILTLVGFSLFTTFVDNNIGSIIYRAIALAVSLVCLVKQPLNFNSLPLSGKCYLIIFGLFLLRVTIDSLFTDISPIYIQSRNMALIMGYGVVAFPFMAVATSYKRLHYREDLILLFVILFIVLILGLWHVSENTELGRAALNRRQSTLTFGDNGAYMVILSLAMLFRLKTLGLKHYWNILLIVGTIIGILSIARAASRGPLLGCIAAIIFLILCAPKFIKILASISLVIFCSMGIIALKFLENLSPVLYSRIMSSIEQGDSSGRDILFNEAITKITEFPIFGSFPVLLERDGNFSSYHNCYLDVMVGLGVLGGSVLILLIIYLAIRSIKKRNGLNNAFQLFILGMLWFNIFRALSGVMLIANAIFSSIIILSCIILSNYHRNIKLIR